MSGNKAAFQFVGSTDMALSAGSTTLLAVIFERRCQRGTFGYITAPGFKGRYETTKSAVKA